MNTLAPFEGISDDPAKIDRLVSSCPVEFFTDNDWSEYVKSMYEGFDRNVTGDASLWAWKSEMAREDRGVLGLRFAKVLSLFLLTYECKMAVAGWMLSLILSSPPRYEPKAYLD